MTPNTSGKTAWLMAAVLCLVVGGGSYLIGAKHIHPLDWRPHKDSSPEGVAALIEERCHARGVQLVPCVSAKLDSLAAKGEVKVAMTVLNLMEATDQDIKRNGHVFAHGIGITAEKGGGDIAKMFSQCDATNESGCYHGVLQSFFNAQKSIGQSTITAVCSPFRGEHADRFLLFQCVHGTGHGLTMYYGHDLPRALSDCDRFGEQWDQMSCYGGAFMENIVNVQMKSGDQHDLSAHEGMHMEGMGGGAESKFKAVDKGDLLYPCDIMADRYLYSCYEVQTMAILYFNGGDLGSAAKTCDTAPRAMRYVCYQSLGRDISGFALDSRPKAIEMCNLGTPQYVPWCVFGLAKSLVDKNAKSDEGIALCKELTVANQKLKCYEGVGEMIATLRNDLTQRHELCKVSESGYVDACEFGARISLQPPGALGKLNASVAVTN